MKVCVAAHCEYYHDIKWTILTDEIRHDCIQVDLRCLCSDKIFIICKKILKATFVTVLEDCISPVARIPRKAVGPVYWESHPQARKRPWHVYRKE